MPAPLSFESEIQVLQETLSRLENSTGEEGRADDARRVRRELTVLLKKTYSNLTPWQTILVSRHPERPQTMDYVGSIFEEFVELHGDRAFGDDRAIRCGFARLGDFK